MSFALVAVAAAVAVSLLAELPVKAEGPLHGAEAAEAAVATAAVAAAVVAEATGLVAAAVVVLDTLSS